MQSGEPPAASSAGAKDGGHDGDEFPWDSAAEAELQAIEAAYSFKRRRLPDWSNPTRHRQCPSPVVSHASATSWALSSSPCRANAKIRYQPVMFGGEIVYCRTSLEVEKATKELLGKVEDTKTSGLVALGFDLEWRPFPRRGERPCKAAVMQLCLDKTHCYVMHIIHSGVPPMLKSLLEDSSSIKVGVCIGNDARKMSQDYGVCVQPLMDLSNLANVKLDGPPKRWSLASLTEMVTCKELPKPSNIRMGNWEADILSKKQLEYAATDAYVSWYLYETLQRLPDNHVDAEKDLVKEE